MHELSIVTNVIDTSVKVAKQQGAIKLKKINLKVGVYKEVIDDALQFSFRLLADDDEFTKDCELNVEYVEPKSICPECGNEFSHDIFHRACPKCKCDFTQLIEGSELEISSIEVERK